MNEQRLHATVEGRVQGVGFRYFVLQNAEAYGVTGWVANKANGDVEVIAEGDPEALQKLLIMLHKGPRSAFVMNVNVTWVSATGEFDHFGLRSDY